MIKHFLSVAAPLLLAVSSFAQQARRSNSDTTIKNTTLDVYQVYKPELKPYVRPELLPSLPPAPLISKEREYNVPQQTLFFSYRSLPLRPLALGKDTTPRPLQNYVKLGGGNLRTVFGEAGISSLSGKDWKAALTGYFDSRKGNIEEQKMLHTGIVADGSYHGGTHNFSAGIEGDYRHYNLYGYDHDIFHYPTDQLSRPCTFLSVYAGAKNNELGPYGITYTPHVRASVLFANPINAERSINLALPFSKAIDSTLRAVISLDGAFTRLSADGANYPSNNVFSIRPAALINRDNLQAHIGLSPTFGNGGNSYLLPEISARYRLRDIPLAISAGWEASLKQNTYRELSLKNPFLMLPSQVVQTRQDEAFAGAEAGIGPHLSVNARGSYWRWNGLPLFLNVADDQKLFVVLYDPKVTALSLQAGAKYQFAESFSLGISGTWYAYTQKTYSRVWGEPAVRLQASLSWRVIPDLQLQGYATWLDGIYAQNSALQDVRLKPTLDVGGTAEYTWVKQLSAFLSVANLLNNRNERWLGYPSLGFNVWGGLRFTF